MVYYPKGGSLLVSIGGDYNVSIKFLGNHSLNHNSPYFKSIDNGLIWNTSSYDDWNFYFANRSVPLEAAGLYQFCYKNTNDNETCIDEKFNLTVTGKLYTITNCLFVQCSTDHYCTI